MSVPVATGRPTDGADAGPVADVPIATAEVPTGAGFRLRVRDVVRETADAVSLVLEVPPEHAERFRYRPGQFLTLRMPGPDGRSAARCYSLASAPELDQHLTVTVKRVDGGLVSNWVCDELVPGGQVDVLPPSGRFTPASLDDDLLLIAGGSGITPILSILRSVLERGSGTVVLIYGNRDDRSVIFADTLRRLSECHPDRLLVLHQLETLEGRPSPARMRAMLAPFTDRAAAYICGPGPYMDLAATELRELGMPRDRVLVERFVSLTGDPFAAPEPQATAGEGEGEAPDAARVRVTLDGEHHELAWPRGAHLLDVLLAAGLEAPFSCREGACSACACKIAAGTVTMTRNDVLEDEDLAEGWVLGCQALPDSDEVEVSYDD